MKVFGFILKLVAALAAIAGIVYVVINYGDKISSVKAVPFISIFRNPKRKFPFIALKYPGNLLKWEFYLLLVFYIISLFSN